MGRKCINSISISIISISLASKNAKIKRQKERADKIMGSTVGGVFCLF